MRRIFSILTAIMTGLALASCSEEIFGYDSSAGEKVTLSLSYTESTPREITVTRSAATEAENALNNLQVFVFDKNGKLKGYKYIGKAEILQQDGSIGTVDVKTTTGNSYIYAVANASTSIYKTGGDKPIPTTADEAWDEDMAQKGEIDFTLDDLKSNYFQRQAGEVHITEANFMMSGAANDGQLCTITNTNGVPAITNPTSGSDAARIKLRRIVSKIKFMVTAGSGVTFTPTRYYIYQIPRQGALIEGSTAVAASDFESFSDTFSKQDEETVSGSTYSTFTLYLPENIQSQKTTTQLSAWKDREADNGDTADAKQFTNAPDGGTYIVLYGGYSKGSVTADVKYFIHLGDFSDGDYSDFNVNRNCVYTYKATITGVNSLDIDASVFSNTDGSGEGVVLDLSDGEIFTLDSHYEKIDMTFSPSDVTTISIDGTSYPGIYFMISDIRGYTGICAAYLDGNTVKIKNGGYVDMFKGDKPINADWIEFAAGSNTTYPGQGSSSLKGLTDVLTELIKNKDNTSSFWTRSWSWSSGYTYSKTYTCFINENYYEDRSWSEFVNTDQRFFYIARDMQPSTDTRTINGDVIYGVRQRSIQTFYNRDKAADLIAYGCETYYDDNYGGNSSNTGNKISITSWDKCSVGEKWNGRKNLTQSLSGSSITSWSALTSNYSYYKAMYACMSRNRDLDGDGVIDDNEVRWYCPTIQQYAGLWIGEDAITDQDALLFTGNTSELSEPSGGNGWKNRGEPALHYYASSNESAFFFWAEEGMATSSTTPSGGDNAPHGVRCVRNLQSNGAGITSADVYYTIDTNAKTIDLSNMDNTATKTTYQETELSPHLERGSTAYMNNPAQKFAYATSKTSSSTTMADAVSNEYTVCSEYTEGGYKWRAPNQSELCLMYITGIAQSDECCRTKFSNDSFRYSWKCDGSQISMANSSQKSNKVYIRCVRDHADLKK